MRRTLRSSIGIVIGVAVVAVMAAFVAARVVVSARSLDAALLRDHAPEVAVVIVASMLAVLALGAGWSMLLRSLTPSLRAGRLRLLAIFSFTWPGRYVPGTVPFLAARVYVASRAGYGRRAPMVATGFQSLLEVLASAAFGAVALAFAREGAASPLPWAFSGFVLALTVAALHSRGVTAVSTGARRFLRRGPTIDGASLPSGRAMLGSLALVLLCNVLTATAVIATAAAFTDVGAQDAPAIAAAVSLSGVAGVLVVLAPAGLGVRDGVLAALLVAIMPLETAASVAVTYRALTVVSDLLLASLAAAGDRLVAWTRAPLPARKDASTLEQRA